MSGASPTFSDAMVQQIREADDFDGLAGAFASFFGFNITDWEADRARGKELLQWLERVKAAVEPMDRFELWRALEGGVSPGPLAAAGADPKAFAAEVNALRPDKPLTELAFDAYSEAGAVDGPSPSLSKVKAKLDEIKKRKAELSREARQKYDKAKADLLAQMGEEALFEQIERMQTEATERARALNQMLQEGKISDEEYSERYEVFSNELKEAMKPLREKADEIDSAVCDLAAKILNSRTEAEKALEAEEGKLWAVRLTFEGAFHKDVIDSVLAASPVTEEEAEKWAGEQEITPAAKRRLEKTCGYKIEQVRKDMAEFYRLTGGRLSRAMISTDGKQRARASVDKGIVYLDSNFTKTTLWHEMGHLLERHPRINAMANEFLNRRTKRQAGGEIRPLRSLTGNKSYRSDEFAWPDDFIDPYVGKAYRSGITEVLSMGMQHFVSAGETVSLYEKDPEMFRLMVGVLRSPMGEMEKDLVTRDRKLQAEDQSREKPAKRFYSALDRKSRGLPEKIEGTIFSLLSYGGRGLTVVYMQDEDGNSVRLAHFKGFTKARMFLYLFLWARQVAGLDSAKHIVPEIESAVRDGRIPHGYFQDPEKWEIADIDTDNLPKELE